jgi:DMSO/TMAO reductase YedYZ molybdopterin-dependent catalytic subunit
MTVLRALALGGHPDLDAFRLILGGHKPIAISLEQLMRLPRVEMAAVNQCSGNSRGCSSPAPGAQWGNGRWAMRSGSACACAMCSIWPG